MKLTSIFSGNCAEPCPGLRILSRLGTTSLACVLLCVMLHNSPIPVMAQEPESVQPVQAVQPDSAATAATSAPERIEIRIEFPIVEPFFDIFYAREEPKIEPDVIAPVANPLKKLPPTTEEVESQIQFRAKRLDKPQMLINRLRE